MNATGKLLLINPNGILVGAGGRIDTAGLLASTLDVPDAEFLAGGDLRFHGTTTATVTNLGTISAREGGVILLGDSVTNAGTITAPNGTAGLAAGKQILVMATGEERIFVEVGSGYQRFGLAKPITFATGDCSVQSVGFMLSERVSSLSISTG